MFAPGPKLKQNNKVTDQGLCKRLLFSGYSPVLKVKAVAQKKRSITQS